MPRNSTDKNAVNQQKTTADTSQEILAELDTLGAIAISVNSEGKTVRTQGASVDELLPVLHDARFAWANFVVSNLESEGVELATKLGFSSSLVPTLLKGYYSSLEDKGTELGMMLPAVIVQGIDLKSYPLLILVRKDLIVTIHSREVKRLVQFSKYADHFVKRLPASQKMEDKLTLVLTRILDENNTRNFDQLREIEEKVDEMSQLMLDPTSPRLEIAKRIYQMKHTLITYLNTLWRTLDVLHSLRYGDADLISDDPKILAQVGLLGDDVARQIGLSEHMSSVLAGGLEVLQAIYNNQLQIMNNRMSYIITWLTILGTAVLVPNTLATIVGSVMGMELPLLTWYMIVLTFSTVAATYLAYWWVKRWVHIPTRTD
ncbi:MAG: CorA family divalent cation transporter [Thermoplasmata archaeon]